jgi:hypothetical protein
MACITGEGVAAGVRAFACFDETPSSQPASKNVHAAMPAKNVNFDVIGLSASSGPKIPTGPVLLN